MKIEDVYKTEGVPSKTFVAPPNYNELLIDIRNPTKPVIVEGQSGTGKTTAVKIILEREASLFGARYLTARIAAHLIEIQNLADSPQGGTYIVDDFHRIPKEIQTKLGNIAKISAEEGHTSGLPKLVLIGINQVGSGLIHLVPDLAKRFGIHRILPADHSKSIDLISAGESALNIQFKNRDDIYLEAQGDYWLTQLFCQTACILNGIIEQADGSVREIDVDVAKVRSRIVERLNSSYAQTTKEFCRGRRFRPSNDPYFKLLRAVSENGSASVDLAMLANTRQDIRASINSLRDGRLRVLIDDKPIVARYFYYNDETSVFAVEDPALFYYIKHLNWDIFRLDCGFRASAEADFEYDLAISYAGENRKLAAHLASSFCDLDVSVFYDEYFENNYLGKAWGSEFKRIFGRASRYIVCILDEHHLRKIWPTFERDCFAPRVRDGAVIPVRLDDSEFPGIPNDLVCIKFPVSPDAPEWCDKVNTNIVYRIIDKLGE